MEHQSGGRIIKEIWSDDADGFPMPKAQKCNVQDDRIGIPLPLMILLVCSWLAPGMLLPKRRNKRGLLQRICFGFWCESTGCTSWNLNPRSNDSKQEDRDTHIHTVNSTTIFYLNKLLHFQTSLLKQLQRCTKTRIKRDLLGSWHLKHLLRQWPEECDALPVAWLRLRCGMDSRKQPAEWSASTTDIESRAKFPKKWLSLLELCCAMNSPG